MMTIKKRTLVICLLVCSFALISGTARADEKKGFLLRMWDRFKAPPEAVKQEPRSPEQEKQVQPAALGKKTPEQRPVKKIPLTRAKVVDAIGKATTVYPEIFDEIPGLEIKGSVGDGGDQLYYGPEDGVKVKLDMLSNDELVSLFRQVNEVAKKLHMDKQAQAEAEPVQAEKTMESIAPKRTAEPVAQEKPASPAEREQSAVVVGEDVDEEEVLPEEEPMTSGDASTKEIPISKDEMLRILYRRLDIYGEIVYMIPNLNLREDAEGNKQYYYAPQGEISQNIEDLDKEKLHRLFVRINNEATRINTQRLMRQIQQQEQIMRQIQRPPAPPPQPPQTPTVYIPPQPPQQPPTVYIPPQPPQQQQPQQPPQVTGPPRR